MIIWLEDTPIFGIDKDEDVVSFIIKQLLVKHQATTLNYLIWLIDRLPGISHTCRKK